jgi:hypothetical protein
LPARMPALPDENRFMGSVHGLLSGHYAHEPRVSPADCKSALRGVHGKRLAVVPLVSGIGTRQTGRISGRTRLGMTVPRQGVHQVHG